MKSRVIILCCAAAIIALFVSSEPNWAAKSDSGNPSGIKIGVISIRTIFEKCKRNDVYRDTMAAKQDKIIADLEKLRADIEADRAGLRTVKAGSSEHMNKMKEILTKQASLTAQQEFYKQQMAMEEQQWIERLYRDIVRITAEAAKERGLDMILDNSEPELTETTAEGLVMSIRTHKVLFSSGCTDITDEVIKKLDDMK